MSLEGLNAHECGHNLFTDERIWHSYFAGLAKGKFYPKMPDQTIHEESAARIQRGYSLPVFENAVRELKAAGLTVIVHVILGLPDETKAQMLDTVRYLADFQPAIDGIKLQVLHILRGTKLAELYEQAPFPVFSMDEYIELLIECIRLLPPDMVIHRISGDGPKKLLIAPEWSGNKRAFLNTFSKALRESGCFQGQDFTN